MPIVGTLPFNIQAGQLVSAAPVMGNYNFLHDQVNANAVPNTGPAILTGAYTIAGSLAITGGGIALTLSGVGPIIQADMTNATIANRFSLQTSTANSNSFPQVLPLGTATQSAWQAFNNATPTNASYAAIGVNGSTAAYLDSNITGTGTQLPWSFNLGGVTWMSVATTRAVIINTPTSGATLTLNSAVANTVLQLQDGTVTSIWSNQGASGINVGTFSNHVMNLITNNLQRVSIAAAGNVIVNAPTAGTALTVNAFGSTTVIAGVSGSDCIVSLTSTNASGTSELDFNANNSALKGVISANKTTGTYIVGTTTNTAMELWSNNTQRILISAAGNVTINAPSSGTTLTVNSGALSVYPVIVNADTTTGRVLQGTGTVAGANVSLNLNNGDNGNAASSALVNLTCGTGSATLAVQNGTAGAIYSAGSVRLNTNAGITFIDDATVNFRTVGTTASAANAFLNGSNQNILKSTSSARYKANVHDLSEEDGISELHPITFTSLARADDPDRVHVGLIAEEVAQVDPRLVTYVDGRPDGVQYDRIGVLLVAEIKRLRARVASLESK